jgi:hypothetical protein
MAENDNEFGIDSMWVKERVLDDWNASVEYARGKLLIEKVKGRVTFLEEVLAIVRSAGTWAYLLEFVIQIYLIHHYYRSEPGTDFGYISAAYSHLSAIRR